MRLSYFNCLGRRFRTDRGTYVSLGRVYYSCMSSSSSSCMRLRVVLFLAQRRAIRLTILDINEPAMSQRHRIKRGVRQVQMTPIVSFTPAAVSLIARVRVSTRTRIRNHDGDALRAGVDASLRRQLWKSVRIVKSYENRVVNCGKAFASLNRTRTASSNHRDRIES